jgi:hypothetical protein
MGSGQRLPQRLADFGVSPKGVETISQLARESARETDRILEELRADVMRYLLGMEAVGGGKESGSEAAMAALAAREGVSLEEVREWRAKAERVVPVEVLEVTLPRLRRELSDADWDTFRRFLLAESASRVAAAGFRPAAARVAIQAKPGEGTSSAGPRPAPGGWPFDDEDGGACPAQTRAPLIVDLDGNGYQLSAAIDGVRFDIDGDGSPEPISWTKGGEHDAFLALDLDHNSRIDDGTELFAGSTELIGMGVAAAHGFEALAQWDRTVLGGNGDGHIDERDEVYRDLRLWVDTNHDGRSQSHELFELRSLQVERIALGFDEALEMDDFGNRLRRQGQAIARDGDKDRGLRIADASFICAGGLTGLR